MNQIPPQFKSVGNFALTYIVILFLVSVIVPSLHYEVNGATFPTGPAYVIAFVLAAAGRFFSSSKSQLSKGDEMTTLDEIKEQIKSLDGASKFLGRKEIKELPSILWEDERIEKIVQGMYNSSMGILVATNKRLVFVNKGFLYGIKVEDFAYDKISSIQYQTGMLTGKITIFASGNKADIEQVEKQQARNFSDFVRARMTGLVAHASAPQPQIAETRDVVSQLEKLAKLKEQGILTDAEFAEQKRKILDG